MTGEWILIEECGIFCLLPSRACLNREGYEVANIKVISEITKLALKTCLAISLFLKYFGIIV